MTAPPPTVRWRPTVVVTPRPGESAIGLLIRHCSANGWPTLKDFASQIGTTPARVRWAEDLPVLAEAIGQEMSVLDHLNRYRNYSSAVMFGQRFPFSMLDRQQRRVCPDCLSQAWNVQEWWELSFLDVCPEHRRQLTCRCSCGKPLTWSDANTWHCDKCEGDGRGWSDAHSEPSDPTSFELWCFTALGLRQPTGASSVLDLIPLQHAVELVEAVGLLVAGGYQEAKPYPTSLKVTLRDLRQLGFDAIVDDTLVALFVNCLGVFRSQTGIHIPRAPHLALGWFGAWVESNEMQNDTPVYRLVIEALAAALGFPILDLVHSRMVTIGELARQHQTSSDAVLAAANASGVAIYESGGRTCVPTSLAADFHKST